MVGDRRTAALSSKRPRRVFLRAAALAVCALLVGACANGRSIIPGRSKKPVPAPPAVGGMNADVHGNLASFDVVEVAVRRPGGDVALSVRAAFRQALYDGLIAKGYSPLALDYVDAAGAEVGRPGQTFPMRSVITGVVRARDGGVVVSGWLGMVAPNADGSESTLYLAEVEDLAVPPTKGPARTGGGPDTGRRLAEALLRKLPAR